MAKPQSVKYENTTVEASVRVGRIMALIQKYGASEFTTVYDERGEVEAVRFVLRTGMGLVPVRIAAPTDRIRQILSRAHPSWGADFIRRQAQRVAWGHLHDLTEQLLLAVHLGIKDVGSAFMDGLEVFDPTSGATVTMGELLARHAQLPSGGSGPIRLLPPSRP